MTAAWMSDVQLVAEREVRERVRSKSFRLMTAVALIAISGVIMLSSARSAKPPAYRVALVDTPASSVADGLAFAVGVALYMKCDDDKWQKCTYYSHALSGSKLNWSMYNKELYAILKAFEQW